MKDNSIVEQLEKTRQQDTGLLHALQNQPTESMASNFSYRTMERIKEVERLRAYKAKRTEIFALSVVAVLAIGVVIMVAGGVFLNVIKSLSDVQLFGWFNAHPLLYITLVCCLTFFGGFNLLLEKHFKER